MTTTEGPVLAAGTWRTNGELIADCARLGYLTDDGPTWDATYGLGNWWTIWRPANLCATDIDPAKSPSAAGGMDATCSDWINDRWQHVCLDPPYKLNGTDQGEGERYGVATRMNRDDRHTLMAAMLTEATRVVRPGGTVLFRCQDQVEGGRVRWQSHAFAAHGERLGLELVDELLFPSYRPQPAGRSQHHARRNVSQLLVFTKPTRPRRPGIDLGSP